MKNIYQKTISSLVLAISPVVTFAFDRQANVRDMYSEIKKHPVQIEESFFTLSDKNGKITETPTERKTIRWYDWNSKTFTAIGYNDAGNPYLYEKATYTNDGLASTYVKQTKAGTLSRRWEYNENFSGYNVYTSINDAAEIKTSSFSVETNTDGSHDSFEYSYNKDGSIKKTKKTVGYPYSGDLRQDAKADAAKEGTVYYYYYEDDKLASITVEKDTESKKVRAYYVNNKRIRGEIFTLNKNSDTERESTTDAEYTYSYFYDGNGNYLQKDSFYEDGGNEIKYSRPLLRIKRSIQYNGSVAQPEIPAAFFAFDASEDKIADTSKQTQEDPANSYESINKEDASKVPSIKYKKEPFTSTKTDPMDDRQTLYIVFNAPQKVNEYADSVSLVIRKKEGHKPEVYINWKEFLNQSPCLITYRIDNEKAKTGVWTLSTDEKASFFDGDVQELLLKLKNADQFIARVTPFNEPPCTAIFDISSFKNLDPQYNWLFNKDW